MSVEDDASGIVGKNEEDERVDDWRREEERRRRPSAWPQSEMVKRDTSKGDCTTVSWDWM